MKKRSTLTAIAFVLAIMGFGTVASVYGTVWCAVVAIGIYVGFVVWALRMFIKR